MPNTFAAEGLEQLASAMVAGLVDGGVLLNTIYRDAESDLVVGKGETATIREPQVVAATDFTGTANVADVNEGKIAVKVDKQPHSQVVLTAKERTLLIEDLAAEVILPQVGGIAEFIDASIATMLKTTSGVAQAPDWAGAVATARGTLSASKVPMADRWLAVAPDVASLLLQSTVFQQGNIEGAPSALADGILGRIYGFTVVESPMLAAGDAIAYHRTALAGVFRTPVTPQGATSGSASFRNVSAQIIYGYDNTKLSDVMTAHALYGLGKSDTSFNDRAVVVSLTV